MGDTKNEAGEVSGTGLDSDPALTNDAKPTEMGPSLSLSNGQVLQAANCVRPVPEADDDDFPEHSMDGRRGVRRYPKRVNKDLE